MRVVTGIALSTFLLTTALFAGMGRAAEKAAATSFSARDLQAKLEYCKTCHGLSGQGYRGSFPMPRLAGQQTEYFENQLRAFIEHRRENRFMFQVAHVLTPEMLVALAAHFEAPVVARGLLKIAQICGNRLNLWFTQAMRNRLHDRGRVGISGILAPFLAPVHQLAENVVVELTC